MNLLNRIFGNPKKQLEQITIVDEPNPQPITPKQKPLSPTQKRLLRHFAQGKSLSINNAWEIRITNPARDLKRYLEVPFGIKLVRSKSDWKDEFGSVKDTVYSIKLCDLPTIHRLCRDNGIEI